MYGDQCSNFLGNFKLNLPLLVENPMIPRKTNNSVINTGRWKEHEHKKFLEAIIQYGNDWKCVHKYIKSRSSTQARSHAQKFLLKLRKKLKISPSYDSINHTMKLSNESIQKIIKEIIDTSSLKNSHFDKEKLVKLIMGFSNLLIGKAKVPYINGDYPLNNYSNLYGNYSYMHDGIMLKQEDLFKKVFIIEKTKRKNLLNENTLNSSHFFIEKTQKLDQNPIIPTEIKTKNIQITNNNDLLKLLLQQNPNGFDPSNPNKNVINIISINICNKNEQENLEKNLQNNLNQNINLNVNKSTNQSSQVHINNKHLFVNKDQLECIKDSLNRVSTMSSLNSSTFDTPDKHKEASCDQEFYEDSSSFFGFSPKMVQEEVDGFFNL